MLHVHKALLSGSDTTAAEVSNEHVLRILRIHISTLKHFAVSFNRCSIASTRYILEVLNLAVKIIARLHLSVGHGRTPIYLGIRISQCSLFVVEVHLHGLGLNELVFVVARGVGLDFQSEEDLLRFRRVVLSHYYFRMSEDCVLERITCCVIDISEDLVIVGLFIFVVFRNNGAELDHLVLVGLVGIDAIVNTRGTHSEVVRSTALVNLLEHESRHITVANFLIGLSGDHVFRMEIKTTEASFRNTVLENTALG